MGNFFFDFLDPIKQSPALKECTGNLPSEIVRFLSIDSTHTPKDVQRLPNIPHRSNCEKRAYGDLFSETFFEDFLRNLKQTKYLFGLKIVLFSGGKPDDITVLLATVAI